MHHFASCAPNATESHVNKNIAERQKKTANHNKEQCENFLRCDLHIFLYTQTQQVAQKSWSKTNIFMVPISQTEKLREQEQKKKRKFLDTLIYEILWIA